MGAKSLTIVIAIVILALHAADARSRPKRDALDRVLNQMGDDDLDRLFHALSADQSPAMSSKMTNTTMSARGTAGTADQYKSVVQGLTRQIMMLQLNAEESSRAAGDSGIKQTRLVTPIGTRPYHSATHINRGVNAIHDHSQNKYTVGMGEFVAVLNGVEFRTRHNDFAMRQPSKTSTEEDATEILDYPEVPPAVKEKNSPEEQIAEMKEWFKAFHNQDTQHRDYRKYFKPVVCYMEGAWTHATESIDEPFESDRHNIEASTWWDLMEKIRFTGYTGTKNSNENFSFLPMKIMTIDENGVPKFAQWNYRILCAPLKDDIPTAWLRLTTDLSIRLTNQKTLEEQLKSRSARFEIHNWKNKNLQHEEIKYRRGLLDDIMAQVPGKDNYQADLRDNAFGTIAMEYGSTGDELNTGFYHRIFRGPRGAMGGKTHRRGFADRNLFMAQTSKDKVAGLTLKECSKDAPTDCDEYHQRWTYAIPLEIVYMTPLYTWNPYNLEYKGENIRQDPRYNSVVADGRSGGMTADTAYDGIRRNIFYQTPEEFFGGNEDKDPADTSKGVVGVLDPQGNVRKVTASGTRILLPEIQDVGRIRTRYPISPLHNDGSQIYKEVEALKDIVLRMETYQKYMVEHPFDVEERDENKIITFKMTMSTRDPPGLHTHTIEMTASEMKERMKNRKEFEIESSESNSHTHLMKVKYNSRLDHPWQITWCGDGQRRCWDGHELYLVEV